jgi:cytochrome P450
MVQELLAKFEYFHERETIPIRGNVDLERTVHMFHARGARWARQRNASTTIFSPRYLKKVRGFMIRELPVFQILPLLEDSIIQTIGHLQRATSSNINIHPYFFEFTMDTITKLVLGQTHGSQFQNPMAKIIFDLLNEINLFIADLSWVFPFAGKVFAQMRLLKGW